MPRYDCMRTPHFLPTTVRPCKILISGMLCVTIQKNFILFKDIDHVYTLQNANNQEVKTRGNTVHKVHNIWVRTVKTWWDLCRGTLLCVQDSIRKPSNMIYVSADETSHVRYVTEWKSITHAQVVNGFHSTLFMTARRWREGERERERTRVARTFISRRKIRNKSII